MSEFLTIWLLAMVVIGLKNLKYSLAMYIIYLILIPFDLGVIPTNYISIMLIAIYYLSYKKSTEKADWTPVLPVVGYYVFHLVLALFQKDVPLSIAAQSIRSGAINNIAVPFLIWNTVLHDYSSVKLYRKVTIICVTIAVVYGLFLTQTMGVNPYMIWMDSLSGEELKEGYLEAGTGRLFGRITSVFHHPMTFGLFLGFAFVYVFKCRETINKYLAWVLLALISLDVLFCGVRSVIAGLLITVVYYLFIGRQYKFMVWTAILGTIGYNLILQLPEMSEYLGSIAGGNDAVGGSSLEMRYDQLLGCFVEIRDCPLSGHGFGWHSLYMNKYEIHPTILCFESLIFVVLCNTGYVGVIFWIFFIAYFYKNNKRLVPKYSVLVNSSLVFYIAYSCITGEYGYMKMFLLFYILILCECYYSEKEKLTTENNKR